MLTNATSANCISFETAYLKIPLLIIGLFGFSASVFLIVYLLTGSVGKSLIFLLLFSFTIKGLDLLARERVFNIIMRSNSNDFLKNINDNYPGYPIYFYCYENKPTVSKKINKIYSGVFMILRYIFLLPIAGSIQIIFSKDHSL